MLESTLIRQWWLNDSRSVREVAQGLAETAAARAGNQFARSRDSGGARACRTRRAGRGWAPCWPRKPECQEEAPDVRFPWRPVLAGIPPETAMTPSSATIDWRPRCPPGRRTLFRHLLLAAAPEAFFLVEGDQRVSRSVHRVRGGEKGAVCVPLQLSRTCAAAGCYVLAW